MQNMKNKYLIAIFMKKQVITTVILRTLFQPFSRSIVCRPKGFFAIQTRKKKKWSRSISFFLLKTRFHVYFRPI